MSSVFLYVGIVVIWLFVLVPRWVRRHHMSAQLAQGESEPPSWQDRDDLLDEQEDGWADSAEPAGPGRAVEGGEGWAAEPYPARRSAAPQSLSRSRVLLARRRLLVLLLLLAAAAGTCAYLKITSWWTCIPPAGMLGGYLLLLREAAVADAERARARAAAEWRAEVARERAWAAEEAAVADTEYVQYEQHAAEVIDISRRVGGDQLFDQYEDTSGRAEGDQLYDQYADAAMRAVGD
jgi:hypothetical protein